MDGFAMLVGHLLGDYILQNDWMASNKANQHPGPKPRWEFAPPEDGDNLDTAIIARARAFDDDILPWLERRQAWWVGNLACTVHCLMYTMAVWSCSFWWMPWWGPW